MSRAIAKALPPRNLLIGLDSGVPDRVAQALPLTFRLVAMLLFE
jgi:hypothetical protein